MTTEFFGSPQGSYGSYGSYDSYGSYGAYGSYGSYGSYSAFGLPESPIAAEAFVTTRDGIVGALLGPIPGTKPGVPNDV